MDITRLIVNIPDSAKCDIQDFTDVRLKEGGIATRVVMSRLLTDEEKEEMRTKKKIIGLDGVVKAPYGKEFNHGEGIKLSYFYIKH